MPTELQILTTLGLAAAALLAVWPVLRQRPFRKLAAGMCGSCMIGVGAAGFALAAGGVIDMPVLSSEARAQESAAADQATDDKADSRDAVALKLDHESRRESQALIVNTDLSPELVESFSVPAGRPAWWNVEPKISGDGIHVIPVASGPFTRPSDLRSALDTALVKATNEYIADQLGSQLAPQLLRYDARTIRERFVQPENIHSDEAQYLAGPMHESFALLEFDQSFRDELAQRWDGIRSTSRLTQLGLFAGAALLLLVSVFGYFRLDTATRGYYTGRLQFATAAAILAVIGAGVFAAQWIHWL